MMSERARPAVRVITCESISATAADRWMAQYRDRSANWRFADGKSVGEMREKLAAANKTYDSLKGILNESWLLPVCDLCGNHAFVVVETDRNFGAEEHKVCLTCAQSVASILSAFPRAADKA